MYGYGVLVLNTIVMYALCVEFRCYDVTFSDSFLHGHQMGSLIVEIILKFTLPWYESRCHCYRIGLKMAH